MIPTISASFQAIWAKRSSDKNKLNPEKNKSEAKSQAYSPFKSLKTQLRHRYGFFWRRKLRWILVVGEAADVELVAPSLIRDTWQIGNDALLIWGGTTKAALDDAWLKQLKRLRRVRPVDAQVWVVKADDYAPSKDKKAQQDKALWQMHARNQQLGYAAPLYLLDLRATAWDQSDREEQAVGTLFPARAASRRSSSRWPSFSTACSTAARGTCALV